MAKIAFYSSSRPSSSCCGPISTSWHLPPPAIGLRCPYAFSMMQGDNLTSTVSTLCNIVLLHVFKLQVGIAYLRQSSRCVT